MAAEIPSRIHAHLGEPFQLDLESMPGAGYEWQLVGGEGNFDITRRITPPAPGAMGAKAHEVLVIVPRKAGIHHVRLQLKRSWESEAAREVDVEVEVGD